MNAAKRVQVRVPSCFLNQRTSADYRWPRSFWSRSRHPEGFHVQSLRYKRNNESYCKQWHGKCVHIFCVGPYKLRFRSLKYCFLFECSTVEGRSCIKRFVYVATRVHFTVLDCDFPPQTYPPFFHQIVRIFFVHPIGGAFFRP